MSKHLNTGRRHRDIETESHVLIPGVKADYLGTQSSTQVHEILIVDQELLRAHA